MIDWVQYQARGVWHVIKGVGRTFVAWAPVLGIIALVIIGFVVIAR